jgi:site-specific DNA-cytosine methylase
MGWPDDHTRWRADGKENAENKRFHMIGNGVVAPVAEWIAKHILIAHLQIDKDRRNK